MAVRFDFNLEQLERIALYPPLLWHEMDWEDSTRALVTAIEERYLEKRREHDKQYQIIRVPAQLIREGDKLIEAYETPTHYVIFGEPSDVEDENDPRYHSCDQMGCGTFGHVVAIFEKEPK